MDHLERQGGEGQTKLRQLDTNYMLNSERATIHTLKCMYTNVDTLTNKRPDLELRIVKHNPDIVGLAEVNSKLTTDNNLTEQEMSIPGYTLYPNMTERGVALYVKESLSSSVVTASTCNNAAVWCSIRLKRNDRLVVGVIYRSPNASAEQNAGITDMINTVLGKKFSHVLIMGDMNYPEIDWINSATHTSEEHPAYEFLECVQNNFLWQHVFEPTHYRAKQAANILDIVMTNEQNMINGIQYEEPIGKSHHTTLVWNMECYIEQTSTRVKKYLYDKADYESIRAEFAKVDWDEALKDKSTQEMWTTISSKIRDVAKSYTPSVIIRENNTGKRRRKPLWANERMMRSVKKKKLAFQRYLSTRDGEDYLAYVKVRNQAKREIRRAIMTYEGEIAKQVKRNPKAFFKYANSKCKTRATVAELENDNGEVTKDDNEAAEVLNKFFSTVFTVEDKAKLPTGEERSISSLLEDITFTQQDVKHILSQLKANKSPGPDEIHPNVLKEGCVELAKPLYMLFRKSLDEGTVPDPWREGHVTPIYKKGAKCKPENYRPISLTPVVSKCMEKLIREALLKHMTENKFLSDMQHGFIPGRSCVTQLLQVLDKWTEILDDGGCLDVIYLDFAKAFDTVPHQRLILKLRSYGVTGKILRWIESFLTARKQRVNVRGSLSTWIAVLSGVPQGSVLGPMLFVCYINDLPDVVTSMIYMYADDTKLIRRIDQDGDNKLLQMDLDSVVNWAETWQMRFNASKCKVMHVKPNVISRTYIMKDGDQKVQLEDSQAEKDLGVWLDSNLNFDGHIDRAIAKANQILGMIKRTFTFRNETTLKQLYVALVRPHLEYANVVWHPRYQKHVNRLEKVQHRATKLVPRIKDLSYEERLRIMELPSLAYRRFRGDAIEVYKYTHGMYRIDGQTLFSMNQRDELQTRGHALKLQYRFCRTMKRQNTLGNRMVGAWNCLPAEVVMAPSVNCFKASFDSVWKEHLYTEDPRCLYKKYCS